MNPAQYLEGLIYMHSNGILNYLDKLPTKSLESLLNAVKTELQERDDTNK